MNSLKTVIVVLVLLGVGYGVYTSISNNPGASDSLATIRSLGSQVTNPGSDTSRLDESPLPDWAREPDRGGNAEWPVLLGVVLVGLGLMILLRNLGLFSWLRILAPVAVVALGIALLIEVLNRRP